MQPSQSRQFGRRSTCPNGTKTQRAPDRAGAIASQGGAGERIASLDLLRLFAALAVVFFHFGYRGAAGHPPSFAVAYPEVAGVAKYGFLGVDLFFLISGFVIAASAEGRTASQFAIARAGRLYPAFAVAMTLTALVLAAAGSVPVLSLLVRWAANLTMFAPALGQPFMDGAYWSIVLEIVFYGWIALFIALGLFPVHTRTLMAVWLAIAAANELTFQLKPLRILLLTEYSPLFASGVLMHLMWKGDRSVVTKALLAVAFALSLAHATSVDAAFARLYQDGLDRPTLLVLQAALYALFWAALNVTHRIRTTPLVLALGGITYPLYLIHQDAGYALIDLAAPQIGRWPAAAAVLVAAVAVAWLIWAYIEPVGRRLVISALKRVETRIPGLVGAARA